MSDTNTQTQTYTLMHKLCITFVSTVCNACALLLCTFLPGLGMKPNIKHNVKHFYKWNFHFEMN